MLIDAYTSMEEYVCIATKFARPLMYYLMRENVTFGSFQIFDIERKLHLNFEQLEPQACAVGALQWTEFGLVR